jgi:hypothetical protein
MDFLKLIKGKPHFNIRMASSHPEESGVEIFDTVAKHYWHPN